MKGKKLRKRSSTLSKKKSITILTSAISELEKSKYERQSILEKRDEEIKKLIHEELMYLY